MWVGAHDGKQGLVLEACDVVIQTGIRHPRPDCAFSDPSSSFIFKVHGGRIQELLSDRRRERDKENHRQREALRQMEEGLKARERIYKERIRGLEEQVEDQAGRVSDD